MEMKNIAKRNRTQNSQTMQFFCLLPNELKCTHAASRGTYTERSDAARQPFRNLQISDLDETPERFFNNRQILCEYLPTTWRQKFPLSEKNSNRKLEATHCSEVK